MDSKALALAKNADVFVVTVDEDMALKYQPTTGAPAAVRMWLTDLDKQSIDDGRVEDNDIALIYGGNSHYNGAYVN